MNSNKKTASYIIIALSLVLVASGIGIAKYLIAQKKEPSKKPAQAKIKRVRTTSVSYDQNPENIISANGRVNAVSKIDISAEVGGRLIAGNVALREGTSFRKGDVLFRVDSRIASLNLKAKKSDFMSLVAGILPDVKIDMNDQYAKWLSFYESIDINKPLPELPAFSTAVENTYVSNKNIIKTYFSLKSEEVQLEKYALRAPYSGTIDVVYFQEGANVGVGARIASLVSAKNLEVEIPIDPSYLKWLNVGKKMTLHDQKSGKTFDGKLIRISDAIDPNTQLINVYAKVEGKDVSLLYDGSYLLATIYGSDLEAGFEIPRKALYDQKEVIVMQDSLLVKMPVHLIKQKNETALIKGLPENTRVVIDGLNGTFSEYSIVDVPVSKDEYKALLNN